MEIFKIELSKFASIFDTLSQPSLFDHSSVNSDALVSKAKVYAAIS
jgi:hypothetical protein